ncbi:RNA polymerase sigma factor [Streptomyces longwoodensis]|uniref:RNA polymerase sigma factor n=1 Tax=Streptomyces longwoodensis TaxID=68231 RepID=UPI0033E96C1F
MHLDTGVRVAAPGPELGVITRARAGDREAFAVLYTEHHRVVHQYLLHRTRDRHLAEDLAQDVFVRALRGMGGYTWQGGGLTPWLITIARNLYLDEMGRSRTRRETPVADLWEPDRGTRGTDSAALRALDAVEARQTVHGALRTLNPSERHCLELRYLGGLSPRETAQVMGRSVGAVRTLTHRALSRLRWTVGVPA